MLNDELENNCGCGEGSIVSVAVAMKLLKRKGLKCLGCVHSSIKDKVLKKWNRFLKNREFGGIMI